MREPLASPYEAVGLHKISLLGTLSQNLHTVTLGQSPYLGGHFSSWPPGWQRSSTLGAQVWKAGRPPEWHGQCRHARGGCGHHLSGPAPLSASQGIKGLLAFVLGSPAPGSLHNKVLPRQIPSPLPSAARGQGTQRPGGGAWHLNPVSGGWVETESGEHLLWSYLGVCIIAEWEGDFVWVLVPPWGSGGLGSQHLAPLPWTGWRWGWTGMRQSLCWQEAGGQAAARLSSTLMLSLDSDGMSSLQPRCLEPCPGQLQCSDLLAQLEGCGGLSPRPGPWGVGGRAGGPRMSMEKPKVTQASQCQR